MKHNGAITGQFSQRVESVMLLVAAIVLSGLFIGCATAQEYPVTFIPPSEFLLGPEDVLVVNVWKNQELSRDSVIVRPDGKISVPLIGDVPAAGVTANVLAKRIADGLAEFMSNPTVSVQVKEINSYFIYVMGEVSRPGKIQLKSYTTVLQGISLAGGFSTFASRNKMYVLRIVANGHDVPREVQIPVPYEDIILGKKAGGNFFLKSGDIIVVP